MTTTTDPYAGLQSSFAFQLHQLVNAVNAQGGHLGYESGFRDRAKQQDLWDKAVKKYGAANAANWAAPPGTSNHEKGLAMDINGDSKSVALAHQLAGQFGLAFPLSNEPWHVQPVNISSHNNQGGPPLTPQYQQAISSGQTPNTAYARIGSLINVLTGQSPTTSTATPTAPTGMPTTTAPTHAPNMGGGGSFGATAYDAQFQAAAAKYGISPSLLKAVAKQESGFNPSVVSPAGAQGLMQFMPGTAKGLGINPLDPNQAIDGAARMLSGLIKEFGGVDKALAAYNAGPGAVQKYGGIPPFKETQNYVKNVMSMMGGS